MLAPFPMCCKARRVELASVEQQHCLLEVLMLNVEKNVDSTGTLLGRWGCTELSSVWRVIRQ